MCKCTPTIRTPFCGREGCTWPKPEGVREPAAPRGDDARAQLRAFCEGEISKARQSAMSRREMAESERSGTEEEHEEARLMAERQSGRRMPVRSKEDREEAAAIQDRIATANDQRAETFAEIIEALSSSTAVSPAKAR